jgi:hypothetical protein
MTRLLKLLALIILAAPAMAQRPTAPVEVRGPDGRTVILKPDGTWEYKKEAPAIAPEPTKPTSPATAETLPPTFTGDDPRSLLRQLVDLRKRLVKSEFETSSAYKARVAEEKKKPLLGDRNAEDSFYLVSSAVLADYNADSQLMSLTLSAKRNVVAEVMRGRTGIDEQEAVTDLQRVSLYVVPLGSYDDPKVFFNDLNGLPLSGNRYDEQFSARVSLNVEDARRLKAGTKAVLTVRFEEPFAIEGYLTRAGQFQVRLLDVQFFDQQTGRVLAKLGSTVVTSSGLPKPPRKNGHLEKAQELYNARRDDEALAELRQLLIDEPTNADAFLLSGRIQVQRNDQEAAIAALKTALFWDAKLIDGHILLGRIFLARGDLVQAKKYAASALAIDPNNAEAQSLQRQLLR